VIGLDAARPFVTYALQQAPDLRASFLVGDALALPLAGESIDAVVSGLALNFIPRPAGAIEEMARVARHGGVVGIYVWDYAEGMQPLQAFWAAAAEADPAAAALNEGHRFPLCRPGPLADLFDKAGLASVSVRAIDTAPSYKDFADFWQPFLGGTGPAPSYLSGLGEEQRIEVRERVRSKLPVQADGGITLLARAWAVRGVAFSSEQ
jgi:SAM-dependent methyltransferase